MLKYPLLEENNMEAIIVEDEKLAAERLKRLINKVAPEIRISSMLGTIEETVDFLKGASPDLIFLDIHLADGSSFEIFEQVKINAPVIFTTAYDEYALKAFEVNSIDYLLKPVDEQSLKKSLDKFEHLNKQFPQGIDQLLFSIKEKTIQYRQRLMVVYGSKLKAVKVSDVAYFFADNKLIYLMEKSGHSYVLDETLDQLHPTLDPSLFFRVNRGFIVNIDAIAQMNSYSRSRIKIDLMPKCDKECITSTEKTPDFKAWLSE
ncbi:LytR/AlgR family response regulator transcription factor [Pleomorphovibrio marinus]|uniref:LytR/AlgR family response regulator transcription factor n=1 Tax=Pleomorphovibrio marinus TaxID=2164132 RepID=UPI001E2E3AFC|nr:LytTR family DNA-binding domain-containing protein [Pleomorphovibrio marinus]